MQYEQVPTSVLLNMMGVSRVRKFVIEEMVRTVLVEYVEKVRGNLLPFVSEFYSCYIIVGSDILFFVEQEGIKAKKSLATDKTADELNEIFEPGQDFGFDATLELEDETETPVEEAAAAPETETAAESEVVSAWNHILSTL